MKPRRKNMPDLSRVQWRGILREISKSRYWIMLGGVLLVGMLLGAALCRSAAPLSKNGVAFLVDEFRLRRSDRSFWMTFASSFEALFIVFLILFLSGVSALGAVAVPLVLLFRGAGLGLVLGYFYATYGGTGFLYSLLMILPNAFLSSIAFLVLSRESIRLSMRLFHFLRPGVQGESVWPGFRVYCVRSGLMLILLCVSSLLDSVTAVAFGSRFAL